MNGQDIFRGTRYLNGRYIAEAEFGEFSARDFERDHSLEAGKVRRLRRPMLIAAVIVLTMALVGCGVAIVLHMQDIKITERQGDTYVWDRDVFKPGTWETVPQQVLTMGSIQGSNNYQAAQEWYEFEQSYVKDHEWNENFAYAPEYAYYRPYTQEMVDKLDEIAAKYGLKLAGAPVESDSKNGLARYLGIDSVLGADAPAKAEKVNLGYYEGGNLWAAYYLQMDPGEGRWVHDTYTSVHYSKADCFDGEYFILDGEDWEEWNFRTTSGHTVMVLHSPNAWESYAFCRDRGDTTVAVYMETTQQVWTPEGEIENKTMSKAQIQQAMDAIDWDLEAKPGDPALLAGVPEGHDAGARVQERNGFTVELKSAITDGHWAQVTLGVTVPEDLPLTVWDKDDGKPYFNLNFETLRLSRTGKEDHPRESWKAEDDGDGRDNTANFVITWTGEPGENSLAEGTQWSLLVENMSREKYNRELGKEECQWKAEEVWKFDFTFDEASDYGKLEFISGERELAAVVDEKPDGSEVYGNLTVAGFTLRRYSLEIVVEEEFDSGDFSSWEEDKYPMVVLKDGSTIALRMSSGEGLERDRSYQETWVPDRPVPLGEVDHVELIDGTRLECVK